jgi:hypothetical protein
MARARCGIATSHERDPGPSVTSTGCGVAVQGRASGTSEIVDRAAGRGGETAARSVAGAGPGRGVRRRQRRGAGERTGVGAVSLPRQPFAPVSGALHATA